MTEFLHFFKMKRSSLEFLDIAAEIQKSFFLKLFVAISITLFFSFIQALCWKYLNPFAFVLFFPPVILCALLGGFTCSMIATVCAALIGHHYFLGSSLFAALQRTELTRLIAYIGNGTLIGFVTSSLSERYQLRANQGLEETLLRMGDGFVNLDQHLRYQYVNQRATEMMGLPKEHLLGKKITEVFPYLEGSDLLFRMEESLRKQEPLLVEYYKESTHRWFDIQAYPYKKGIKIFYREITDKKIADQELKKRAEEAIKTSARLREMNQDLERTNIELSHFAHMASHDMKEPLRMISNYVQLLELQYEDSLEDNTRQYIRFVVEGTKRMHQLINGLLKYSELGMTLHNSKTLSIEECVQAALQNCRNELQKSQAMIKVSPLASASVQADALIQILEQLLSNALKFHAKGSAPEIEISVQEMEKYWKFTVQDHGIGISPSQTEHVFKLFYREHPQNAYAGSGIGLAICRRIADYSNGNIWVESKLGEGTTVHFTLPKLNLTS